MAIELGARSFFTHSKKRLCCMPKVTTWCLMLGCTELASVVTTHGMSYAVAQGLFLRSRPLSQRCIGAVHTDLH